MGGREDHHVLGVVLLGPDGAAVEEEVGLVDAGLQVQGQQLHRLRRRGGRPGPVALKSGSQDCSSPA